MVLAMNYRAICKAQADRLTMLSLLRRVRLCTFPSHGTDQCGLAISNISNEANVQAGLQYRSGRAAQTVVRGIGIYFAGVIS
mmetsp:Transcript_34915/g.76387  ORF Transcript_34915/g.76387 Transcript_34915/m.76387 type:complete len:82 (-) Transcript_34915:1602-1847(-)